MKVLLCGYYGHRNFGDDLLLRIVADRLLQIESIETFAIMCDPKGWDYISNWYPGVQLVDPKRGGLSLFRKFDRVVFGGGGTVFDYRKGLPLSYHLKRCLKDFLAFRVARLVGTRFAWIGVGIGPFGDERAKTGSMRRLRVADHIFVRDEQSMEHVVSGWGGHAEKCADLSLFCADSALPDECDDSVSKNHVLVVIRHFKYGGNYNGYLNSLIEVAKNLRTQGLTVSWAAYQDSYDSPAIAELLGYGEQVWVWDPLTMPLETASDEISRSSLVVTGRMHAIYLAGMLGVPVVGIELDPKIKSAANMFGDLAHVVPPDVAAKELLSICTSMLKSNQTRQWEDALKKKRLVSDMFDSIEQWF